MGSTPISGSKKKAEEILCVYVFISGQILNLLKVYGGITMVGHIDVASVSVGKYVVRHL